MKTNFKISSILSTVLIALLMISCITDLDKGPIDPRVKTSLDVYTSVGSYKQGLAKLYAAFVITGQTGPFGNPDVAGVDEGFSCFIRSLWNLQELTTDEAVWTFPNDANGTIFNLHYITWVPSDNIPTALFARIMNVVALTNEFIRATAGKTDPDLKKFNAEARFLRALAYYYGIDLFGNLPFVTEADIPGAYFPPQKSRAEMFAYVESELKAIEGDMGAPRFEYGRADQGARAMLLAKLYLNAQVYIGTPKYTEAITEINKVIAGGYTLSPKYANLFRSDNNKEVNTGKELIFTQNSDGLNSESYDGVQVMIFGNAGNGGWSGLRTTSAFVNKFPDLNEARAIFAKEGQGQSLEITNVSTSTQGYGVYKFRNVNADGTTPPGNSTGFQDTDFPMFRLADAYLIYAEAVLRGGSGGTLAQALTYVNAIRTRPTDVANGNAPGVITSGQLDLPFILDERAREMYWEGQRRSDLIRFGKYTGASYLWPFKGGAAFPTGTSIADTRALFPIPAQDIGSNPNLKQNPGY